MTTHPLFISFVYLNYEPNRAKLERGTQKTTDNNKGQVIINGNRSYPSEIEKKICFTLGELVKFASICLSLMSSEISLDLSNECQ